MWADSAEPGRMTTARFQSLAHWGAFTALVDDGRLVGCEPFSRDPAPSAMLDAMPAPMKSDKGIQDIVKRIRKGL